MDGTGSGSLNGSVTISTAGRDGFPESKPIAPKEKSSHSEKSTTSPSSSPGNKEKDSEKKSDLEKNTSNEPGDLSESEEDIEPVDVLLQFIPYYGQGDPSNDRWSNCARRRNAFNLIIRYNSIVRATLSGLSVEDIDSKDEFGNTLLLLACQYRCEDLVRIMVNFEAYMSCCIMNYYLQIILTAQ